MESSYTSIDMLPLPSAHLAKELSEPTGEILLVDVRPSCHFTAGHIESAENVNFSAIILRRLMKGVVSADTMITSPQLAEKICKRLPSTRLVLYDGSSTTANKKPEIMKHATVLQRDSEETVYFLEGGFAAFSAQYPSYCEKSAATQSRSPAELNVCASLPIFSIRAPSKSSSLCTTKSRDTSDLHVGPPVQLLPHLLLGCAKDSANLSQLRQLGVTAILNVSHNCTNHYESLFEYKNICVEDSYNADLLSKLNTAIEFIDSIKAKGGCVLVHCHAGISRSATVCIAYIMKKQKQNLTTAYDFVKSKRSCISPNLHFMGQLVKFEKELQEYYTTSPESELPLMEVTEGDLLQPTATDMDTATVTLRVAMHQSTESPVKSFSAPSCLHLISRPKSLNISGGCPRPKLKKHYSHGVSASWPWCSSLSRHSVSLPCTLTHSALVNYLPTSSIMLDLSASTQPSLGQSLQQSPCRLAALYCDPQASLTPLDMNSTWTA